MSKTLATGHTSGIYAAQPQEGLGDGSRPSTYSLDKYYMSVNNFNDIVPKPVRGVLDKLEQHGCQAYLVGGCVRDIFLGKEPQDWDIATNALPEKLQKIFPRSRYDNAFGTVGVHAKGFPGEIHVTTFREEWGYSDFRRPDEIKFTKNIQEDLARRDFTINAIAWRWRSGDLVERPTDPYQGRKDIKERLIRAVGDPSQRFREDALRLLRAVRFAVELDFKIAPETSEALKQHSALINKIASERVRDEFVKIIASPRPDRGIELMRRFGLLNSIIPELLEGYDCQQNKHHIYDVYHHNLYSLKFAARFNYSFEVRLAALLHDIGKPKTKRGEYPDATFYHHEVVGARMTRRILERLKFPRKIIDEISHLVRHHLFYYDIGVVSESGVRRLLRRVGKDHIRQLLQLRMAERKGSGVPKARPYRLRHLEYMLEKVQSDPIEPKMLAVDGNELMKTLRIKPGPRIGLLLKALLEEVLDDPKLNNKKYLLARVRQLNELSDQELKKIGESVEHRKRRRDETIKRKYHVR